MVLMSEMWMMTVLKMSLSVVRTAMTQMLQLIPMPLRFGTTESTKIVMVVRTLTRTETVMILPSLPATTAMTLMRA